MLALVELRDRLQSSLGSTYTFERELGGGGMSRVFVGEEGRLGRKAVVKVTAPELAGKNESRSARPTNGLVAQRRQEGQ
jgi:serine/threonine-protein kinase